MKSLYRHKRSGDIFAIEIGELGNVRSTSGPLFSDDLDPKLLDYDEYWNTEVQAKLDDFIRITKEDYKEILRHFFKPSTAEGAFGGFTHGSLRPFVTQFNQKHLF